MAKGQKTGGRKPGSTNKTTAAVKDMILQALSDAGGVKYLVSQAAETPTAFLSLVGKTLPLQVGGDKDNPIRHIVEGLKIELSAKLDRVAQ